MIMKDNDRFLLQHILLSEICRKCQLKQSSRKSSGSFLLLCPPSHNHSLQDGRHDLGRCGILFYARSQASVKQMPVALVHFFDRHFCILMVARKHSTRDTMAETGARKHGCDQCDRIGRNFAIKEKYLKLIEINMDCVLKVVNKKSIVLCTCNRVIKFNQSTMDEMVHLYV
jgi:hypothetical protein